ncbi:uncharacterized protein LOC142658886 isoform X1 [Rhinoderma darwinii]|uniref:uncharacterized protein LOC142658886 isoform X1 n=1 Tax=Rhinoderma darwinii TaxID=43563 RepID=UPI003F66FC9F
MRGSLAGLLLVYNAISLPATGYVMQEISYCGYGDDEQGNVTFKYFMTFNHMPALMYDTYDNMFFPCPSVPEMRAVVEKYCIEFNTKPDMLNYVKSEEKRCKDEIKTFWNGTVERSEAGLTSIQIIKISVSAATFALGLITLIAGVICWKNAKKSGYTPITGYDDIN